MGQKVVVRALGETPLEAIESNLALEPQDRPSGDGVVVAIESGSVGWVDLLMTSGQYQHLLEPPYVPGLEWSGRVVESPSPAFQPGDRVLVDPFLAGPRSIGAHQRSGGFATWAQVPAEALRPIPGGLSFDQAANLLGNYETAYHCLIHRGRLRAGETVLILGASGATGLAAVHLAKLVGATVIAVGRSEAKLAVVKAEGADHVIAGPFKDAVKALGPVDVVYDGVGGEASLEALRTVRFGARYLIVGWASTPFVARGKGQRGAPNANLLPTNLMMMKGLDVLGCPTFIATTHDPSIRTERLARILEWAEAGQIRPVVSKTWPLAEFRAAMRSKWTGEFAGGLCVRPDEAGRTG